MKNDLKKNNEGYSIPTNYFSDNREALHRLHSHSVDREGYQVPNGYFDQQRNNIKHTLKEDDSNNQKRSYVVLLKTIAPAIAALLLGVYVVSVLDTETKLNGVEDWSSITTEDLSAYIDNESNQISYEWIANEFDGESDYELNLNPISSEEVVPYLEDDINTIPLESFEDFMDL